MPHIFTLTFLSLVLTVLSSCSSEEEIESSKEILPEVGVMEIQEGNKEVFSVNGEVTAAQSASLTAELRSEVSEVLIRPGDEVQKGQILLRLLSNKVNKTLESARSSYFLSQENVGYTNNSNVQNIESARIALEKAERALENILNENEIQKKQALEKLEGSSLNLDLSKESSQATVENAQESLERAADLAKTSEASDQTTLENSIRSAHTTIQSALITFDEILGVTSLYEHANDSFEDFFSSLNFKAKHKAENDFSNAYASFETITFEYESTYNVLKDIELSAESTLNALNNSFIGVDYPQSTLNTHISSVTTDLTSIRTALNTLISAQKTLDKTVSTNKSNISSAEQVLLSAQKSLDSALQETNGTSQILLDAKSIHDTSIAKLKTAEDDAKKQLESARVTYELSKKSAGLAENTSQSSLSGARGNYDQAVIDQQKLIVRAPFAGRIIDVSVKLGDEVNPNDNLLQIENDNLFKIISYLSSAQALKIHKGDEVRIGKKSKDIISAIASTVDPNTGKYKVEVQHKNPHLHSGQIIPLRFEIERESLQDTRILIPLNALHVESGGNFVWLLDENNLNQKQEVETSEIIASDIYIDSGLVPGDRIIIKGGRLLQKDGVEMRVSE
jgi:multidrug efflux pump subunit AcrA (membrane-fusion protein)